MDDLICSLYFRDPCALYSIREISLKLNKAYPQTHKRVSFLLESGLFVAKQVGKSLQCMPNYANPLTLPLLAQAHANMVAHQAQNDLTIRQLLDFLSKINLEGISCIFLQDNKLHVLAINEKCKQSLQQQLSSITISMPILFHLFSKNTEEYLFLLGGESTILYGFEYYYSLIRTNYSALLTAKNRLIS